MTAAVAAGWFGTLAEAASMARAERGIQPDPALAPLYGERFSRFASAYRRLRPLYNP
jgi:sugar (pentulose or hexulose) kinase